jgi:hypothetical protein
MTELKNKIIIDINQILFDKNLDKGKISIFSMKIFYYISDHLKNNYYENYNNNDNNNSNNNIIYKKSGLCADNVECIINNLFELHQLLLLTDEEIYKLVYNIIITNIKFF